MEGRTYRVAWTLESDAYTVVLARKKSVSTSAKTLQDALDLLSVRICELYDDGEPQFILDPPAPRDRRIMHFPFRQWIHRFGDGVNVASMTPKEALYPGRFCDLCNAQYGRRLAVPLEFESLPSRQDFARWYIDLGSREATGGVLVSDRWLNRFEPAITEGFELADVKCSRRSARAWFELRPRAAAHLVRYVDQVYPRADWNPYGRRAKQPVEPAAPAAWNYVEFLPCFLCGAMKRWDYHGLTSPRTSPIEATFVRRADVPATNPPLWAVTIHKGWWLSASPEFWAEHRTDPLFRSCDESTIALIPDELVAPFNDPWALDTTWPALDERGSS